MLARSPPPIASSNEVEILGCMNLWELNESHLLSGQHAGLIRLYLFLFLNHIELFFLLVLIDVSYVIHLISENYMRFVRISEKSLARIVKDYH